MNYQLGSPRPQSWHSLFHRSDSNKRFDETQEFLLKLLERRENFSNEYLEKFCAGYLSGCKKFDWTYYYLKYRDFRPNRYGKYRWADYEAEPYVFCASFTPERFRAESAYRPFLRALVNDDRTFKEHYDYTRECLTFGDWQIESTNDGYTARNIATGATKILTIQQDGGVDTENRIERFKIWNTAENFIPADFRS